MVMLHRDGSIAYIPVGYAEDMLDSLLDETNALLMEQPASTVAVEAR
jgi:hypothetical protein